MPAFDAEVLRATADVDALFAETFVIRPYAQGANKNAPETPDPTRDVVSLCGLWREKLADPREPNAYDPREYRRPGVISDVPVVEFSASALSAFASFEIRDGDHIERPSNATVYRARAATFSPNGTLRVPVNRLGAL